MKQFLIKLSKGLFITSIFYLITFFIVYDNYYKKYLDNLKDVNTNKILLSDSHGLALNNLEIQLNVKNLSFGSDNFLDMYRKLDFVNSLNKIDTVYISLDEHLFSSYRDNFNNNHISSFIAENKSLIESINDFNVLPGSKGHLFFQTKIKSGLYNIIKPSSTLNKKDQNWEDFSNNSKIIKAKKRVALQFKDFSILQSNYFDSIYYYCNKFKIKLIGVKFPLSKDYLIVRNNNPNFKEYNINYHNIQLIDFSETFIYSDSFFRDQDHVNEKGSNYIISKLKNNLSKTSARDK
jgi:hypothetical protein